MATPKLVTLPEYPLVNWVNFLRMQRGRLSFVSAMAAHGDLVTTRLGPYRIFFVNDPDYIKEILVTQARKVVKGRGLERAKRMFGEGLLTSEGELHLRQRQLSQPAFHRQRILTYGAAMVEFTRRYVESLRPGELRPMDRDLMRLTLAIAGKTLFDSDIERDAADVGQALDSFLSAFPFLMFPYLHYLEKLPLPQMRRLRESVATLDRIIYQLIAERRRDGRDHGDLLSTLIAAQDAEGDGGGMTDRQLRDELVTLMLAGHETTSNGLAWTLYLLSQYPACEARLHAELDAVLGDRAPTAADLPRPTASTPSASRPRPRRRATASPTFRSRPARATASARASPGPRACWCWRRSPSAGSSSSPPASASSRSRCSPCGPSTACGCR